MDSLIHADVFFFVTTIAVVVVGVALTVVLIYIAKIMRDIKKITGHVHDETVLFREDLAEFRADAKRQGFQWLKFAGLFKNMALNWFKKKPHRSKK